MKHNHITIQDKALCCGCEGCANACPKEAITIKEDEYGFVYPTIDESICVDCGKCIAVCPLQNEVEKARPIHAYAAVNKNEAVLIKSSSGGVFSAVAEYVFQHGGAVCGCVFDEQLRAVHICTENPVEMVRMRGSKYLQSSIDGVYGDVAERLKNGQTVLFTGTPCQVAGLYGVLGNQDRTNLITVDLVCHGVPSALMFREYIAYLEKKHNTKIVDFEFRSKKYGWQRSTLSFTSNKGKVKDIGKVNEFYYPAFSGGNTVRPSCFSCPFACSERVGDITVGDFWGHEQIDLSQKTQNGVSLCTFNTERAMELYTFLTAQIAMQEIDYQVAVDGNRCLHAPTQKGDKWELYMEASKNNGIEALATRYIRKNKKKILRNKLKLYVPYGLFMRIRKKKYGKKDR